VTPKYQQIQNELKKEITAGKFQSGEKFYTEAEIIKHFQVSSITAVRALNELVKDGYIVRQQGRDSFVSRARKGRIVEFSDIELFPINEDQVTVLSITRGNNDKFLKKLKLPKQSFYYRIERLRTTRNHPYIYQQTYLPEQYVNPNHKELSYYNSIYERYRLDYNIHMTEEAFEETNEISFPTPQGVANKLQMSTNEPSVLQIKTTTQRNTRQVLEYVESYKKWDFYKFNIKSEII